MTREEANQMFTRAGIGGGDLGLKINEVLDEQLDEIVDDQSLGQPVLDWIIDQLTYEDLDDAVD